MQNSSAAFFKCLASKRSHPSSGLIVLKRGHLWSCEWIKSEGGGFLQKGQAAAGRRGQFQPWENYHTHQNRTQLGANPFRKHHHHTHQSRNWLLLLFWLVGRDNNMKWICLVWKRFPRVHFFDLLCFMSLSFSLSLSLSLSFSSSSSFV